MKRGATKNFTKWVEKRYDTLMAIVTETDQVEDDEESQKHENLLNKVKTKAAEVQIYEREFKDEDLIKQRIAENKNVNLKEKETVEK